MMTDEALDVIVVMGRVSGVVTEKVLVVLKRFYW